MENILKRYVHYSCTVCKRTIDKIVDNARVTPDRCTITLSCQGRLVPLDYRSDAQIATAPEIGLIDWAPRLRPFVANSALQPETFVDTSTGSYQQLVLGVPLSVAPADGSTATLNLEVRSDTPKDFRQYTFRLETTFTTVGGVESGVDKKTLRYTATGMNPDLVEVYLNGVKLEQGLGADNYQIYDGSVSSLVPPNTILFNSAVSLPGVAQVDVVVSKAVVAQFSTIEFAHNTDNDARLSTGAWENVDYIERFDGTTWTKFYLYTCDMLNNPDLRLNTLLIPSSLTVDSTLTPLSGSGSNKPCFLLARQPYSAVDRYLDVFINLDTFSVERDYLKYVVVDGAPALMVTTTAASTFFPPSRPSKFNQELTIKTAIAGVSEQVIIDGATIVGPDL